jgi:hypothetical protein
MMARSSRRRVGPATTWLIRAFAPGCPTMLRSWASQRVMIDRERFERLTIIFDLPDEPAFSRAVELESSAATLAHVRVGKKVIRELAAEVSEAHRTLKIEALLATDESWGIEPGRGPQ